MSNACPPDCEEQARTQVERAIDGVGTIDTPDNYETNRDRARKPRGRSHWCLGCDMARVNDGSKCPNCGTRDVRKREKP